MKIVGRKGRCSNEESKRNSIDRIWHNWKYNGRWNNWLFTWFNLLVKRG